MSENGLLFVLAEPGRVGELEFHTWYDRSHAPARLTVPGITAGWRYRAADALTPTWLALYTVDLDALTTPQYQQLRHRSAYERDIVNRLAVLDRRVYRTVEGTPRMAGPGAPYLVTEAMDGPDPADVQAWCREEHIPLLRTVPGWLNTTCLLLADGDGPNLLAVHEIADPAVFDTPEYRYVTSTRRRAAVLRAVTSGQQRLFAFHNQVTNRRQQCPSHYTAR
ncbi:hypothetical protein [Kutzneria sp. NPDC052558]|uniref:hypothetical protein n=1 Tax=Kutzneria sp. NPDC052558 TaxID=3364121 RepID=UPI0037C7CF3C